MGSQLPSTKLTTTVVTAAVIAGVGRITQHVWGWELIPDPWVVDLIGLAVGALLGWLVPETNPSESAVDTLIDQGKLMVPRQDFRPETRQDRRAKMERLQQQTKRP